MMPKKTFRDAVNVPHKKIGEKIKKIKKNEHPKTGGDKAKKIGKIAGLGLLEFITWAIKYGVFDNQITRKLEDVYAEMKIGKNKQGQNKKFSSWIKKHPEFSSYMTYWLAILMMVGIAWGGKRIQKPLSRKENKKEIDVNQKKNYMDSYKDFKETMHTLTNSIMLDMVFKEGTKLNKDGMCIPYQDGKGIWTIGFGLTYLDGKPVTKNTKPISMEKAWKESIKFLEDGETYFFMWCYTIGLDNLSLDTPNKACALASIIYNSGSKLIEDKTDFNSKERNTLLRKLYKNKGDKITVQEVKDLFKKYPPRALTSFGEVINKDGDVDKWADALGGFLKEGGGIYWRRWAEGQIAKGNVNANDLLQVPWLGGYDFFMHMGGTKTPFFSKDSKGKPNINDETVQDFKLWLKNPVDKHGDKITRQSLGQILTEIDSSCVDEIKKADAEFSKLYTEKIGTISLEDALKIQAQNSFDNKNYSEAIAAWNQALKINPDNPQIMDNMVAAYIKNEQYNMALNMAAKIINGGYTKQFKTAYYNIGLAYEGLGQIENALDAYKKAKEYGNESADKKISELQGTVRLDKRNAYKQGTQRINAKARNVIKHTPQKRNMA